MTADRPAFTFSGPFDGQLVATSIHAGHDVRADLARRMVLDEDVRFREEDPFTDRISGRMPSVVRVHRSRFEVDLNRDREGAVYATPDDCWGLVVWEGERLDEDAAEESRRLHDEFYAQLARHLDPIAARGPFAARAQTLSEPTMSAAPDISPATARASARTSRLSRERIRSAWLFLAPMLIVLAGVALYPLYRTIWFSFTDASLDLLGEARFIGWRNYLEYVDYGNGDGEWFGLLADSRWWRSVWNTVWFAIVSVSLETLWFEDLGDGTTRLHAQSLCDSFEARDGWLASGMEVGVDEGYGKLDALLADDAVR